MQNFTRLMMLAALVLGAGLVHSSAAQKGPTVEVFKSPTCGCCSKWVTHLERAGFTVRTTNVEDITAVKTKHKVPGAVESCHTGVVDGYVIEGHVPADDVKRMLKERPAIVGIGVRGMPVGSPGMEVEGVPAQRYNVLAFDKAGKTSTFATH